MALVFQVLSLSNIDEVYGFAERKLAAEMPDETLRAFQLWSVRWRKEALEHYLKLGWSFIARENDVIAGFFLAQPLLFFRGHTQSLWVEHIEARDSQVTRELIDVAVRVAREKHLQSVLFSEVDRIENELSEWKPVLMSDKIAEVRTTKG